MAFFVVCFRLFTLKFRLCAWRASSFRKALFRLFVFLHGVFSSFRFFAWLFFVFSHGVFSREKTKKDEMAQSSHHTKEPK